VPVIRQTDFVDFLEGMQHCEMRLTIRRNRECARQCAIASRTQIGREEDFPHGVVI
jgi:hypothetical protein